MLISYVFQGLVADASRYICVQFDLSDTCGHDDSRNLGRAITGDTCGQLRKNGGEKGEKGKKRI